MVVAIDSKTRVLWENHVLSLLELAWEANGFFNLDKLEMGVDISLSVFKWASTVFPR